MDGATRSVVIGMVILQREATSCGIWLTAVIKGAVEAGEVYTPHSLPLNWSSHAVANLVRLRLGNQPEETA